MVRMKAQSAKQRKKVFVALRMAGIAGQGKLAGIFRYLSERYGDAAPWDIEFVRTRGELTRARLLHAQEAGARGFILSIPGAENDLAPLAVTDVPTVLADVADDALAARTANLVRLHNSARDIGRAAATYLMGQGIARAYAFLHAVGKPAWSAARFAAFRDALRDNGLWCTELDNPVDVVRLKKGTAVFAANDDTAFALLERLRARRLKAPGDFAVLGVDNDTLICENARPRLSSIQPDFEEEGFAAAKALDEMMRAPHPLPARTLLAGIKRIVRRESTAEISHAGRLVQRAVAYIDAHALEGIGVRDVVAHLGCSRRLADMRFRQLQGRTILDAIMERRLAEVRRRLVETREAIDAIALDCGFANPIYLKTLFKKRYSMTMRDFRRNLRS